MIALTNSIVRVLAPGDALIFDTTIEKSKNCSFCHRTNTASVNINDGCNHILHFTANIGSSTADSVAELTIRQSGEAMIGGIVESETTAAGGLNNVSVALPVIGCCSRYSQITIVNTGDTTVNVDAGAVLMIN